MIVEIDRPGHRYQPVAIRMSEEDFRETVEWLEGLAPRDGFTVDLRAAYDRLFPPRV